MENKFNLQYAIVCSLCNTFADVALKHTEYFVHRCPYTHEF